MYDVIKAVALAKKIMKGCASENKLGRIKLLKLMYMSERQMYATFTKFITGDRFVSMQYGIVLSTTYNLISDNVLSLKSANNKYWDANFGTEEYFVVNKETSHTHYLEENEEQVVDSVIDTYGAIEDMHLVDMLHIILREWEKTESSIPLDVRKLDEVLHPLHKQEVEKLLRK